MENQAHEQQGQTPSDDTGSVTKAAAPPIDFGWIINRAKQILTEPTTVWPTLRDEEIGIVDLYKKYIIIMAAIGPVCQLIGTVLFIGGFITPLLIAVVTYGVTLVSLIVMGAIASALAGFFEGKASLEQGFRFVTWTWTASAVGGVGGVVPMIGWLISFVAGCYSVYLMWQAIPDMVGVPQAKRLWYIISLVVVSIVVWFVLFAVVAALGLMGGAAAAGGMAAMS